MTLADDTKTFLERIAEREAQKAPPKPPTVITSLPHAPTDYEEARRLRYAQAALQHEAAIVATAANGTRNHTLNQAAFNVGRFVTEGILTPEVVSDELGAAARQAGLDDSEIAATLQSGLRGATEKRSDRPAVPPPNSIEPDVTEVPASAITGTTNNPTGGALVSEPNMHPVWGSHVPHPAANYLFDHEDTAVALWGNGDHILWAEGEALMIAGGMGLGKTTLAGQIVRAQLGLEADVLGLPVAATEGPILYLAMDRPRQIRRSMLRQFDPTEREALANLLIRPGPPLADLAVRPSLLAEMAHESGATTIYVDSLKDAAIGLSSDEVGAAYNRARQYALANDCQLCELHHLIKRNPNGGAPNSVADVYGSNWLTAGAGSVVMLTGDPGDPIIEFRHAKQPHTEVGPWRLLHDTVAGRFSVDHEVDLLALAAAAGANGLTPHGAAAAIFERDKPTRAQVEKARRRLDKLVATQQLVRVEGMKGGVDGGISANYFTAG